MGHGPLAALPCPHWPAPPSPTCRRFTRCAPATAPTRRALQTHPLLPRLQAQRLLKRQVRHARQLPLHHPQHVDDKVHKQKWELLPRHARLPRQRSRAVRAAHQRLGRWRLGTLRLCSRRGRHRHHPPRRPRRQVPRRPPAARAPPGSGGGGGGAAARGGREARGNKRCHDTVLDGASTMEGMKGRMGRGGRGERREKGRYVEHQTSTRRARSRRRGRSRLCAWEAVVIHLSGAGRISHLTELRGALQGIVLTSCAC